MYTTTSEGILNNYAIEPAMYYAEYPTETEQNRYKLQGAVASLFVALIVLTSLAVS